MTSKTLRLLFPQWQGGNNPPIILGHFFSRIFPPNRMAPLSQFLSMSPQRSRLVKWMALQLSLKLSGS